jgi:hypothetical protein
MSEFKLDTNVPMPTVNSNKYPFDGMDVGDSFFVPGGNAVRRLRSAAAYHARQANVKYSTRVTTENDTDGARCWRVA